MTNLGDKWIILGDHYEMRRIDDEDTARKTGPARSHETAPGREGVFTKRFVRLGAASPFLATKGARARTKYAQRDHEGLCFCIIPYF